MTCLFQKLGEKEKKIKSSLVPPFLQKVTPDLSTLWGAYGAVRLTTTCLVQRVLNGGIGFAEKKFNF